MALNESGKRPAVQGIRRAAPAVPVDDKAGVAGVGLEEALDCWEQLEAQGKPFVMKEFFKAFNDYGNIPVALTSKQLLAN